LYAQAQKRQTGLKQHHQAELQRGHHQLQSHQIVLDIKS
jgi:hypothetical protein